MLLKYILLSILWLFLFPLNLSFTSIDIGIYFILNFIIFILFWIFPVIYIYIKSKKEWLKWLVLINIIIFILMAYLSNIEGEKNQKIMKEKMKIFLENYDKK